MPGNSQNSLTLSKWIDGHAHLTLKTEKELDRFLHLSQRRGPVHWIMGGVDPVEWQRQRLLQQHLDISCVFGIHPWQAHRFSFPQVRQLLEEVAIQRGDVIAIGETGLDFTATRGHQGGISSSQKEHQLTLFREHLALSRALDVPVVVHVVAAHGPMLALLKPGTRGLVHGFNGSLELAKAYLSRGLTLGLGPALLKPGYDALKKAVKALPPGSFLLESDEGWVWEASEGPSGGNSGETTRSAESEAGRVFPAASHVKREVTLLEVADALSALTGLPADDLLRDTSQTAARLFRLQGFR